MDISALEVYHVGGKYYCKLKKGHGGPKVLGKQLIEEVPTNSRDFQVWKYSKIQHFLEEDIRLLSLSGLGNHGCGGYIQKPSKYFPGIPRPAQWLYVTDLDDDTFLVCVADVTTRVFSLKNIPRWLFESSAEPSPRAYSIKDDYHIFTDAVPCRHLSLPIWSTPADTALVAHCQSFAPRILPLPVFPDVKTFSVRKQFRLVLLKLFYNENRGLFHDVQTRHAFANHTFRELAYSIINLARSTVEVGLLCDNGYNKPEEYGCQPTSLEHWIDDILVVLDTNISTMENLHAAIGKAIKLTNARASSKAVSTAPSAIICSLSAIVLVYIRGDEISHTPNMYFFPWHAKWYDDTAVSDGVLALFDIFLRPPSPNEPQSYPGPIKYLPTEICQHIYSYACPLTRIALEASCRLFRGIANDHGLYLGGCYFQKRSEENGSTTFVGEVSRHPSTPTRRTLVYLDTQHDPRPVYWAVMRMPNSPVVKLALPSLQAREYTKGWYKG